MSSMQKLSKGEALLSHPFEPVVFKDSKVLILGTFPSIKSFEDNFYYSHPKNQFWKLLSALFEESFPTTISQKKQFLKKHKIALWDMVKSCSRENSLDSSLKNITPNDIETLLKNYPNIQAIFFTGRKAQEIFKTHFSHLDIPSFYLPSPSPAMRSKSFQEKLKEWSKLKDYLR